MKTPAFVDFETRSRVKLKLYGSRRYIEHESTECVCAVLRYPGYEITYSPFLPDTCETLGWCNKYQPPKLKVVAAHNGVDFDRHVWRKLGWPEPREWIDTSYLARLAGMPQASLEWLAQNLLGRPKDLEGSKLTKSLSAISRAKKTVGRYRVDLAANPDVLERVIEYCALDVELLAALWGEWLSEWYEMDLDGYESAQLAMNDRGILFDYALAGDLLEADEILASEACAAAGVSRKLVTSNPQMLAEMARRGCPVPNCQAGTFDAVLLFGTAVDKYDNEPPSGDVVLLIKARQACASIAAGKLRAGLARVSPDGRLRDNTRIMGAHTGRESGRGVQLQNLAKGPALDIPATLRLFDRGELKAVHLVE